MKRNDIKALHDQTSDQLVAQIDELEKEFVLARMKHRSNQETKNAGRFKIMRKDIARMKTILKEKSLTQQIVTDKKVAE